MDLKIPGNIDIEEGIVYRIHTFSAVNFWQSEKREKTKNPHLRWTSDYIIISILNYKHKDL